MSTPVDLNLVGAIGDIPTASSAYNGKTYFATDEDGGTFYRCNGTIWVKVAAAVSEGGGVSLGADGWAAADALTYAASDAPTYTVTCPGDQTTKYSPGMRIKLTDSTVKYFIVTNVAYISSTTITLYGGTDYTLSGGAITSPYYSAFKSPAGFPSDPTKWQVVVTDVTERSQVSITAYTWYNLGSISISIPIGAWHVSYKAPIGTNGVASHLQSMTLSTANNSQSDADFTTAFRASTAVGSASKLLTLTAKTVYYLNTSGNGAGDTIYNSNDGVKLVICARCAYL